MDVTGPTPSEDITPEETPKVEEVVLTRPTVKIVEIEVHQDESIISLHALFGISSPQTLEI